jgi:glycosyltransferase involved in cell wall biosynthesis
MEPRPTESRDTPDPPPSLLVVTTVPGTMHFLLPYVGHFRQGGWRVDGAASGISTDEKWTSAFESVHDVPFSRSLLHMKSLAESASTLASILRVGYDIVHVHTPIASFITRAVTRRMPPASRPSVVYTAHGFHFHRGGHPMTNALFLTAERVAGRWTDRLVVINEEDFDAAKRHRLVPHARLRHMRGIGVDTDWYSRSRVTVEASRVALREVGIDPDRPYFVTVGELNRNKRPTDVVRALSQMREREPALLFLGGGDSRALLSLASELGVSDRVAISRVDDVRPFVAPAIALVHASKREGLPRSIMEALSLGVPVITSDARGSRELVGADRGHVVPIGDTQEMATAMDRFFQSPEECAEMGQRGRRQMVERYDLEPLIREHERLYDELLMARWAEQGRQGAP